MEQHCQTSNNYFIPTQKKHEPRNLQNLRRFPPFEDFLCFPPVRIPLTTYPLWGRGDKHVFENTAIDSGHTSGLQTVDFSKLRMEHSLRMNRHTNSMLGGAQTFHAGNILVVLGSIISILAVCMYAYEYVWILRGQKALPLVTLYVVSHTYKQSLFWEEIMRLRLVG